MEPKIDVSAYVAIRKKELDAFEAHWRVNQNLDVNSWPEEMNEGDWFEQEAAFANYGDRHD